MSIVHNHGDIILYPVKKAKPPKTATFAKLHILQQSTPTGNRHEVVDKKYGLYVWSNKGKEFLHCDNSFILQHVGGDCEHGVQNVEAGTWEIRHEMEHDPWKEELRAVID